MEYTAPLTQMCICRVGDFRSDCYYATEAEIIHNKAKLEARMLEELRYNGQA